MTQPTIKSLLCVMALALWVRSASGVGAVVNATTSPAVAYGVLVCAAEGTEFRVRLFDFSSTSVFVNPGELCIPFIAQLKSRGFQLGPATIGSVVPNVAESLVWEVQGTD